jgi:hypothetical protein
MRDCTTIADQELRTECELLNRQEMQAEQMRAKQSQQGGGPSPSMAMKFIPESGAGAAGAGELMGGSGVTSGAYLESIGVPAAAAQAGGTGGAAASGGGAGAGAGLAAAWPAAVIAGIALMENKQNKEGNRASGSKAEYVGDMASGKVLERDAERYLGKDAAKFIRMGTPSGAVRGVKDAFKNPKKLLPWEWF